MGFHCLKLLFLSSIIMTSALNFRDGPQHHIPEASRIVKETFLVGSEFEESMITHLLNSSTMVTINDDITSLLSSTNLTYTLATPDEPFVFVERNYFWSKEKFNEFADSDNTTSFAYTCVYNVSHLTDGIFSQIYFPDGEQLSEVVFGCENNKECCGMKCCGDDVLINIIIVGAISLALLFLLLCNILIGFKKRREKGRKDASATYQATDTTNENEGDMVSPDQITYETRHPAMERGTPAIIEENGNKRI